MNFRTGLNWYGMKSMRPACSEYRLARLGAVSWSAVSRAFSSRIPAPMASGAISAAVSWLAYYPVWSLMYIGISVLVIYALIGHYEDEAEVA